LPSSPSFHAKRLRMEGSSSSIDSFQDGEFGQSQSDDEGHSQDGPSRGEEGKEDQEREDEDEGDEREREATPVPDYPLSQGNEGWEKIISCSQSDGSSQNSQEREGERPSELAADLEPAHPLEHFGSSSSQSQESNHTDGSSQETTSSQSFEDRASDEENQEPELTSSQERIDEDLVAYFEERVDDEDDDRSPTPTQQYLQDHESFYNDGQPAVGSSNTGGKGKAKDTGPSQSSQSDSDSDSDSDTDTIPGSSQDSSSSSASLDGLGPLASNSSDDQDLTAIGTDATSSSTETVSPNRPQWTFREDRREQRERFNAVENGTRKNFPKRSGEDDSLWNNYYSQEKK
jgi:clumping factor A